MGARWGRAGVALGVVCVVLVTSAGACNRDLDGPVPTPVAYGAPVLPEGWTTSAIDAVYARPVGSQCHRFLRLAPDGSALTLEQCFVRDLERRASDLRDGLADQTGDYAYEDGALVARVVEWEPIAGELVLHEWEVSYCATSARGTERSGPTPTDVVYELVIGAAPPDADPCPLG